MPGPDQEDAADNGKAQDKTPGKAAPAEGKAEPEAPASGKPASKTSVAKKTPTTITASVEGTAAQAAAASAKPRILVVEDSMPLRRMLGKILSSDGFQVDDAPEGGEAIKKILDSAANPYKLMILDLMMPGLDGVKTMAKIKVENIQNVPPVIICSCRTDRETIALVQKLGAIDYILKPFKTETVINRVRKALHELGQDAPGSESAPKTASNTSSIKKPKAADGDKAEAKPDAQPDAGTEAKPEAKADAKPDADAAPDGDKA